MAYRGQPQIEQAFLLCQRLMIPWPPNAQGIYMALQEQKHLGSKMLERNQLQEAQAHYSVALEMVIKMPLSPEIQNEYPKLQCNLALIFTKQGRFGLALEAADSSIAARPDHVKGYWRAGQAAKTMFQGENRALPYIVLGLNQSLKGYGTQDDIVSFLTELCTLIPSLIVIGAQVMQHLHQIPNIQDVSIWKKVVTQLSNNSKWNSLIMLVTVGVQGPQCKLDGRVKQLQVSCAGVSVGTLLFKRLNEFVEIPQAVIQACVEFFKLGAPIDDIVVRTKLPPLNVGVMVAFKSQCLDLLSYLLGVLHDVPEKRDAQDERGYSSYHLLIKTGFVNSPLGSRILQLLLVHDCDPSLRDINNKRPIDLVTPHSTAYNMLLNAKQKSIEALKKEMESLKTDGNLAQKSRNLDLAYRKYTEAISLSRRSKDLNKDAAILFSNRANVLTSMDRIQEALTDAVRAIQCNPIWQKGHWWKAKCQKEMGKYYEAFHSFMDGYEKTQSTDLVHGAAITVYLLTGKDLLSSYARLMLVDREIWPQILERLSKAADWRAIAFLILGTNCQNMRAPEGVADPIFELNSMRAGAAGQASTRGVILTTVFDFLQTENAAVVGSWLDLTLLAVLNGSNIRSLCVNEMDEPLHAAARFALMTGKCSILEDFPSQQGSTEIVSPLNRFGDSVYHTVTKFRPLPNPDIVVKVTELLQFKGLPMIADSQGNLPVHYLNKNYPGHVFDIFFKANKKQPTVETIKTMKEIGNQLFKKGDYWEAIDAYTEAITWYNSNLGGRSIQELGNHEVATLYSNRAEGYLKIGRFGDALEDAKACVGYDGHWYKGHQKVGRALKGLGDFEFSLKAFTNAFKDVDGKMDTADLIKVEVMSELAEICSQHMNLKSGKIFQIPDFPQNQGQLWARATYELISKKDMDPAFFCFNQFKQGRTKPANYKPTLKPLCNVKMVKNHGWMLELILYFLECGSDRQSLSLESNDTYFHAVVGLTLASDENVRLLNFVVKKFVNPSKHHNMLDRHGNTVLHLAAKSSSSSDHRYNVVLSLLYNKVDPNMKNKDGCQAIDLLSKKETKTNEILRMKMFAESRMEVEKGRGDSRVKDRVQQPVPKSEPKPAAIPECDACVVAMETASTSLRVGNIEEAFNELTTKIIQQNHRDRRHDDLVRKALSEIVKVLGASDQPEIPMCLTRIGKEFTFMLLNQLASGNKWRQLDTLLRKCRYHNKADSFKRFAKDLSIVPVVSSESLKNEEELKQKIVKELLDNGATMGTDGGVSAVSKATGLKHFRLLRDLLKAGADLKALSMYKGDTPVHAALVIALEKKNGTPDILEMLLDLYKASPEKHSELNPETLDRSGNCLYHLVAKPKYTNNARKLAELLCKRKVSARFYNNKKKYPQHYITKKDDRRMQFLRLAASIEPMSAQEHSSDVEEDDMNDDGDDDLRPFSRSDEVTQSSQRDIQEISKALSKRQMQKQKIEQIIRLLPDSSSSIFTVDYTPTKPKVAKQRTSFGKSSTDITEVLSPEAKTAEVTVQDVSAVTQDKSAQECEKLSQSGITTESGNDMEVNVDFRGDATPGGDSVARQPNVGDAIDRESAISEEIADKPEIQEQGEVTHKATGSNVTGAMETVDEEMEGKKETETENDDFDFTISSSDDEEEEEIEKQAEKFNIDSKMFDNMEWEVECTADVWKTLRDKHVPTELKRRIVHKIQLLASGEWLPVLCKPLKHVPLNLKLYEAKFSKGSRIMWEQAIAFSPRCSETAERRLQGEGEVTHPVVGGRIYSEIIRVWDIVLDHDKIYRSVQRIIKSHSRGEDCIIQKKLKLMRHDTEPITGKHFPKFYAESDVPLDFSPERNMEMQRLFPPASANETEYHILKFYSFSSALVSHVLQNIETKVDFPFRVTDLEHAIINLESKAPILLLGRSGTGKTTCCLYRLWSQFLSYWIKAREAESPLLPRCVEFIHQETDTAENEENTEGVAEDEDDSEEGEPDSGACGSDLSPEENSQNVEDKGQVYDHLHQLFITKNAVLCSEVQKNFRELRHADETLQAHVDHEEENLPNRLQEINDLSYPLFLTSRQLLLTLDASIGPPYFFERKDDGSLKVDIQGWTDGEGPLSILPLLEDDSDDEDEDGVEQSVYGENDGDDDYFDAIHTKSKKRKIDPRREITYEVFVEEVWPRIKKSMKVNYHPSLIWVEIMSFIKGSYEALSKSSGCLSLKEYEKLGKKRAPNFTGARDKVYEFYKRYDHFKRQHSLFDETDLVHDMFQRLRGMTDRPWVIHQIFVDETQDFTQAELCLLIRLCQNPNAMFLTGDTAQSIMRGISFRFSDLRSLFYHAQKSMQAMGKTSAVEVPKKVYQLTHNYRSHAGILSLASAVLDILVEFFPESFDRLKKDQGLFNGPQPILLESCSFGDLAVLLRGNRRKTSHIEFGAHQAILVVNDAARDAIPEELRLGLVLTIYEAKGLEFDDVLIYNFFKDSQAVKEWRVVTDFLERLNNQRDGEAETSISTANLVELDADVLQADNGPRPLTFDPNSHKVLNSELKHLYTALTRARVNVWIFDEDSDKRAPMFQYFKARKLVKSLKVSDINDSGLSDAMFAEKSSKQDWIKRGEDFMKNSLYQVAAKCFGMGGEEMKQKVALAHWQALTASRLKENPRQMREEFTHAAELYLECEKPGKAALCLQNARERELAAQLFEKLGQFGRAADIYRKMKRPLASSRCYEQLGQFNHAIEVLSQNENYDIALDTLQRYHMLVKDMREKNSSALNILLENRPGEYFTEDRLSYNAADQYHRYKNTKLMNEALERLPRLGDRVEFLKNKGYIPEAAEMLTKHGEQSEAIALLLQYGRMEDAVLVARHTLIEEAIANTLLVSAQVLLYKNKPKEVILPMLEEAASLFESINKSESFGRVTLYIAKVTKNVSVLKGCWRAFLYTNPTNEVGLIECVDLLVKFGGLNDFGACKTAIRGLEHVFSVCKDLLEQNTNERKLKALLFYHFYGLYPTDASRETLRLYPKQKPRCLNFVQNLPKPTLKQPEAQISAATATEALVVYLLSKAVEWLTPVWDALKTLRSTYQLCPYWQVSRDCPLFGNVDKECPRRHAEMDLDSLKHLTMIDSALVECEYTIQNGAMHLRHIFPPGLKKLLDPFLGTDNKQNPLWKYESCEILWKDLFPDHKPHQVLGHVVGRLLKDLRKNEKIWDHMRNYVYTVWKSSKTGNEKLLKTDIVRSTEPFLILIFGTHLFGLDTVGRKRLNPAIEITQLEMSLTREMAMKQKDYSTSLRYYTLMGQRQGDRWFVQCIARRFLDGFQYLSTSSPEPYEAIFAFTKFIIQLEIKEKIEFLPKMGHLLFWIEFYTTLSFFIIAKMQAPHFPDFLFVLPASYLTVVKIVEASFQKEAYEVEEQVHVWKMWRNHSPSRIQERLKFLINFICGVQTRLSLINICVKENMKDPEAFALAERTLVLGLTMVCNVGKTVSTDCEARLVKSLTNVQCPEAAPSRLKSLVKSVKSAKGLADVAQALLDVLKDRDEECLVCLWSDNLKQHVQKQPLIDVTLFSKSFVNEDVWRKEDTPQEEVEEEIGENSGLTLEDIQRGHRDQEAIKEEEKEHHAARVITRFLRALMWRQRSKKRKPRMTSHLDIFRLVQIDDQMCGVCGVSFKDKLTEQLKNANSDPSRHADERVNSLDGKRPDFLRLESHDTTAAWSTDQNTSRGNSDKDKLEKIKQDHENSDLHIQKMSEFEHFRKEYELKFELRVKTVKDYLFDETLGLQDQDKVTRYYQKLTLDINRMKNSLLALEQEVQNVINKKMWHSIQQIQQHAEEMFGSYHQLAPRVKEIQDKIAQEKEKAMETTPLASSSRTSVHDDQYDYDPELDDIEKIVEDPKIQSREYWGRNRGKGRYRQQRWKGKRSY